MTIKYRVPTDKTSVLSIYTKNTASEQNNYGQLEKKTYTHDAVKRLLFITIFYVKRLIQNLYDRNVFIKILKIEKNTRKDIFLT